MVEKTNHATQQKAPPKAQSVDREPSDLPTPAGHGLPVNKEDEPKGHPNSDRFDTEQAHRGSDKRH